MALWMAATDEENRFNTERPKASRVMTTTAAMSETRMAYSKAEAPSSRRQKERGNGMSPFLSVPLLVLKG